MAITKKERQDIQVHVHVAKFNRKLGLYDIANKHMRKALTCINKLQDPSSRDKLKSYWFSANNKLRNEARKAQKAKDA